MANEKLITLDNLRRFKQQLDQHGGGGGSGDSGVQVWRDAFINSEAIWTPDMKVGDIVVDDSTDGVYIIVSIQFTGDELTSVRLQGLGGNLAPVEYYYENEEWGHYDYTVQLYQHSIRAYTSNGSVFSCTIITTSSVEFTYATLSQFLLDHDMTFRFVQGTIGTETEHSDALEMVVAFATGRFGDRETRR